MPLFTPTPEETNRMEERRGSGFGERLQRLNQYQGLAASKVEFDCTSRQPSNFMQVIGEVEHAEQIVELDRTEKETDQMCILKELESRESLKLEPILRHAPGIVQKSQKPESDV